MLALLQGRVESFRRAATEERDRNSDVAALASLEQQMQRFLDGDVAAFEVLFFRLAPRLRRTLRGMTGDRALAEDLTQATFLKLVRARHTYHPGMSVEAWIWTIAKRVSVDERRRRIRQREVLVADVGPLLAPGPAFVPEPPGHFSSGLEEALLALPALQREALLLLKVQELSAEEAALATRTTPAAVKMRAQRGVETLRRTLSRVPRR